MMTRLLEFVAVFPPEMATLFLAALPITELRAALPVALFVFKLPVLTAYVSAVVGNMIPLVALYLCFPSFMKWVLPHIPWAKKRLDQWLDALEKKYGEAYSKWGAFFLFLFVAVPLPGTGVWTATVLALFFHIKRELAIPCIMGGVLVAGLLVLAFSQGVFQGLKFL